MVDTLERIRQAYSQATDKARATRQVRACLDEIRAANRVEALDLAVVRITERLEEMAKPRSLTSNRGGEPLTSTEAADAIGICRSSLSMLVSGGHVTPSNIDAPNGAGHKFDPAHIKNFIDLNSSGQISRMISDYRHRERRPRRH